MLATGIQYPFSVSTTGGISNTQEADKVLSNLITLVKSSINERVVRKGVGTVGFQALFRPAGPEHSDIVKQLILEAITKWEPRATAVQVSISSVEDGDGSKGIIDIAFIYRDTGDPANARILI